MGPTGFFRQYRGGALGLTGTNLVALVDYEVATNSVKLVVKNASALPSIVTIQDVYRDTTTSRELAGGATWSTTISVAEYEGWYDFVLTVASDATFQQQLAGHLETGRASMTDPALG